MAWEQRTTLSLDQYQLRLPVFEGPLDVLLRLIERNQLAISDVSLLAVFDQFMAFARALESSSPLVVAEFAAVAGRLSVLKSRALLPRPATSVDDGEASDLVRQLEEYRAVKAAAELLAGRQRTGHGAFGRGDGLSWPEAVSITSRPQPPTALSRAVNRWLARVPTRPVIAPFGRAVSLREMTSRIFRSLERSRSLSFEVIRSACANREEVGTAFLALLVLIRRHSVVAIQETVFGSISIQRAMHDPGETLRSISDDIPVRRTRGDVHD